MSKVITVASMKGGTGKSTTVASILSGMTAKGYKALAVDLDGQCNLSAGLGADLSKEGILEAMVGECRPEDTIQHTKSGDLIVADSHLANLDNILGHDTVGKEYKLREVLERLKSDYDYIIVDTPPATGILTANGLTAGDYVVVPTKADLYSLQGLSELAKSIKAIKQYCNHSLQVAGVLLTMFNNRARVHQDTVAYIDKLAQELESSVFNTRIRYSLKIAETPYSGMGIFQYAPKEKVAEDYRAFIEELIERTERE